MIPDTIRKIFAASYCNIGFVGGSLTAAAGAGDTTVTSWRRLFVQYIYERYHRAYHCQPMEVMGGVGAMESFGAVFTLERNVIPFLPTIVFVEFCVNDRNSPDKDLVKKGIEGIIRQLRACKSHPDVVLVGAGCRPGSDPFTGDLVDHTIHRDIADYYGLPFIDVQDYLLTTLAQRGQTWDDVSIVFEAKDSVHLNDYGNRLWFEALREWFEEQVTQYRMNPTDEWSQQLPPPCFSDEFQYTSLIDPSRRDKRFSLEGSWETKNPALVPWYLEHLLIGRPGDKLTFTFSGTAIGAIALVYCNGLKVEAVVDGEKVIGPYTNFSIEFGKFFLMKHGMENREHVLELAVAEPMRRQNKLEDPQAQIGYLCVAKRE